MKKLACILYSMLLMTGLSFVCNAAADTGKVCFDSPPGVEGIKLDTKDEVVLQRVDLGPKGREGFIATEYLGSPNLQASVYLKTADGYCLAGELDGLISFKIKSKPRGASLFDIKTEAVSGSERFFRTYRHTGQSYQLMDCSIKNARGVMRACAVSER